MLQMENEVGCVGEKAKSTHGFLKREVGGRLEGFDGYERGPSRRIRRQDLSNFMIAGRVDSFPNVNILVQRIDDNDGGSNLLRPLVKICDDSSPIPLNRRLRVQNVESIQRLPVPNANVIQEAPDDGRRKVCGEDHGHRSMLVFKKTLPGYQTCR
jgi:hypothetical protein